MRRFLIGWLLLLVLLPFIAAQYYTTIQTGREPEREISRLQVTVGLPDEEKRMGVTEFLTGVVAGQIPAEYEMETLKAQSIIARTILYVRAGERQYINESETGMEWWSESRRRSAWGIRYQEKNKRIQAAVEATDGKVLYCDGKLILPAYFAVGNGRTRSGQEAWGVTAAWLQPVDSPWDVEAEQYETVAIRTRRQVVAALKRSIRDFDCSVAALASTCQITEIDSSGYVQRLQVGNKLLTGEDFRYALDLPSSCFDLEFQGNEVIITVKGVGHGVGFDQYGANRQALEGKNCEELLLYYLSGVKVGE